MLKRIAFWAAVAMSGITLGLGAGAGVNAIAVAQPRQAPLLVWYVTEPAEGCTFVIFEFPNGDHEVFPARKACVPPPPPTQRTPPI